MLKYLDRDALDSLLATIAADYRLLVPQLLDDGSRQLGPYGEREVSLVGEALQRKPTSQFFPQTQKLLDIDADGAVSLPASPTQPLALFGLNSADLAGIRFLDRFFLAAPADDVYLRNRQGALLIGLGGASGPDKGFLPLTAGDCDIELIASEDHWLAQGFSPRGAELLEGFQASDPAELAHLRALETTMVGKRAGELALLQQASYLLQEDRVPDEFWEEIAARCILCSGCNLACPTCNCFCVQDRARGRITERSRVWDSCQLDAFMREASGHNPLGTEALRTRRRIHHKLVADVQRWGEIGCVACGRCDRACPSGIGMLALVGDMVQRYG